MSRPIVFFILCALYLKRICLNQEKGSVTNEELEEENNHLIINESSTNKYMNNESPQTYIVCIFVLLPSPFMSSYVQYSLFLKIRITWPVCISNI